MNTYGYIRVSTSKQTVENQRHSIIEWCKNNNRNIDEIIWVEETVSGTKDFHDRKIGLLIKQCNSGDEVICTEISRLGRSIFMVLEVMEECAKKNMSVYTIKEGFQADGNVMTKVVACMFAMVAEMERSLISQRTKEALELRKAMGVKLGRPKGAKGKKTKLSGKEEVIKELLNCGNSYSDIARALKCDRTTLTRFCKTRELGKPVKKNSLGAIKNKDLKAKDMVKEMEDFVNGVNENKNENKSNYENEDVNTRKNNTNVNIGYICCEATETVSMKNRNRNSNVNKYKVIIEVSEDSKKTGEKRLE